MYKKNPLALKPGGGSAQATGLVIHMHKPLLYLLHLILVYNPHE